MEVGTVKTLELAVACAPGACRTFIIGNRPSESGYTYRMCSLCGEIYRTDRLALGLPAQVVVGPPRTTEELAEVYH